MANVTGGGKAVVEIVVRYCEPACRHAESDGCVEQARASVVIKEVPYESGEYARAQNTRRRRAETKRMRTYRAAVRGREETYGRLWPAISRSMDEISLSLSTSAATSSQVHGGLPCGRGFEPRMVLKSATDDGQNQSSKKV